MNNTFDYTQYGSDTLGEKQRKLLAGWAQSHDEIAAGEYGTPGDMEAEECEANRDLICSALRHIDRQQAEIHDYELATDALMELNAEHIDRQARQQAENQRLEKKVHGAVLDLQNCEQEAGKALGYPWFKVDQKNFPGSTEKDGVAIGEHCGSTIVAELASAYQDQKRENAALKAEVERLTGLVPKCCDCGKAIAADELAVCSNCMYSGS